MLSILVTCYNQKDIIIKTLDSLVNQDTSFEYNIIVSDDLSTDGSYEQLCTYAKGYSNIIITQPINKKRVGHNRNNLIKNATNKFSVFVDGDDIQDNNFVNLICSQIDDDNIYKFKTFTEIWSDDNKVVKNALDYENIFLNIYKTSVLKELSFNPDIKIGEDVLFSLQYNEILLNYKKVVEVNYNLNRRDDNISLTKNGSHKERFDLEVQLLDLFIPFENLNEYTKIKVNQKKVDVINYAFIANEDIPRLKISSKYLPKKHKISYFMYKILPSKLYKKIIFNQIAHKL